MARGGVSFSFWASAGTRKQDPSRAQLTRLVHLGLLVGSASPALVRSSATSSAGVLLPRHRAYETGRLVWLDFHFVCLTPPRRSAVAHAPRVAHRTTPTPHAATPPSPAFASAPPPPRPPHLSRSAALLRRPVYLHQITARQLARSPAAGLLLSGSFLSPPPPPSPIRPRAPTFFADLTAVRRYLRSLPVSIPKRPSSTAQSPIPLRWHWTGAERIKIRPDATPGKGCEKVPLD